METIGIDFASQPAGTAAVVAFGFVLGAAGCFFAGFWVPAAGRAEAVVGLGAAAGLAGAGFSAGAAVEAAAGVAAGFSAAEAARTALRHDPDNLLSLRCRHCSASMPPGVTLPQFAM